MNQLARVLAAASLLLLTACGLRPAEGPFIKSLDQLIQQKNGINVQGRALTEAEIAFVEAVEKLEIDYAGWKEKSAHSSGRRKGWKKLEQQLQELERQSSALAEPTWPPFSPGP